jgi:ABC-type antimicrobial peptide transport system permease subunit
MDPFRVDAEFIRTVLAQALGTLLAALAILLIGLVAGVVGHIDLRTWLTIIGALVGVVTAALISSRTQKIDAEARHARTIQTLKTMTDEELAMVAKYRDKAIWNNLGTAEKEEVFAAVRGVMDRRGDK